MHSRSTVLGVCLSAFLLLPACSGDDEPVATPEESPFADPTKLEYGKSHAEWGSAWWTWTYELPQEEGRCIVPPDDADGSHCAYGQDGADVFFLAGNYGGTTVRDACVAPASKPVFFPVMNYVSDNGGVPEDQWLDDGGLAGTVQGAMDAMQLDEFVTTVDGSDIDDFAPFAVQPTKFRYTLPTAPNTYTCLGAEEEGLVDPSYQGGYYVMLKPLSPGAHTIHFAARQLGEPQDFVLDVTYHLTLK